MRWDMVDLELHLQVLYGPPDSAPEVTVQVHCSGRKTRVLKSPNLLITTPRQSLQTLKGADEKRPDWRTVHIAKSSARKTLWCISGRAPAASCLTSLPWLMATALAGTGYLGATYH